MVCFQSVLSAVADFLKEAQSIGLIKEYVLTEINQNEDVPDAHDLICKFVNIIKELPVNSKASTELMPSLTAESNNITTNETAEVTKKSESPAKEVLIQMEIDESEATTEMVSSPTSKTSSEKAVGGNESHVDRNLVQIQADESEINRRISAFISRKRKDVDEWNVQEFCSRPYVDEVNQPDWEGLDSCARVDTVFVPRSGCKSHVKVSKVVNRWGPHLQMKKIKQEPGEETEYNQNSSLQAVEERLQNMESHLKLKTDAYEEARKRLPQAEISSNLDTDIDVSNTPQKSSGRNLRRRALDPTISDSDVEEIEISKRKKKKKTLPLPPAVAVQAFQSAQASQSTEPLVSQSAESQCAGTEASQSTEPLISQSAESQCAEAEASQSADLYINEDGFLVLNETTNTLSEPVFRSLINPPAFCSNPNTPAMPLMSESTPRRVFHQENPEHQPYNLPEDPVGNGSLPGLSKLKLTPVEREIFRWMENINYTLGEQSKLLANVLASSTSSSGDPSEYDFPALPIKNDEDMLQWEEYLSTATNLSKAVKFFSVKGGSDVSTVTRRVMKSIITIECASCYNWAGRGGKKPFKDLLTRRLITCAVRENKNAKIASEKDVEEAIKNWLKYCPLRLKYAKRG